MTKEADKEHGEAWAPSSTSKQKEVEELTEAQWTTLLDMLNARDQKLLNKIEEFEAQVPALLNERNAARLAEINKEIHNLVKWFEAGVEAYCSRG